MVLYIHSLIAKVLQSNNSVLDQLWLDNAETAVNNRNNRRY
jgi:hypothetical protein